MTKVNEHDMHIITIATRNSLRVLQRISGLFSRYSVNIDQMSIFSGQDGLSHFSIIVYSDDHSILKLTNQLHKIIEVCDVRVLNNQNFNLNKGKNYGTYEFWWR